VKKSLVDSPNEKLLEEIEFYKQAYVDLKTIMDSVFDQITIADGKGLFLMVSKCCEEIFGISEREMVGKSAYELERQGVFTKSITTEVLKTKKKVTLIQETASGKILFVTGVPLFDKKGNINRIINISRDITEAENLKKQLEEAESTLEYFKKKVIVSQIKDSNIIIGNSISMKNVINMIQHTANIDSTILLLGETGTGKSNIAKNIHAVSNRKNRPFVQINCGAIPESLLESELYGYEGGAFTGAAKKSKKGLFEVAKDGTIFLDEISELSFQLQVKLLHALQNKQAYRLGGVEPFDINARIIAATNKDLKNLVKDGKFREDLFYRINVIPITVPALRDRREDIPIFINYFLQKNNEKYGLSKQISIKANNLLRAYDWPGNIRELENTVERIVITCSKDIIDEQDMREIITPLPQNTFEIADMVSYKEAVRDFEKKILLASLEKYKTTRKAAEALGIDQSTIVKKLKKLNASSLDDEICQEL